MPTANNGQLGGRDAREGWVRRACLWMIDTGYVAALPILGLIAIGIAVYGFTVDFGEGARSVIFFVVPVLWGAYALAVNDGKQQNINKVAQQWVIGIAVAAALTVGSVILLSVPIAITDLALGIMVAFFFLMWTSDQPSRYIRKPSESARIWMLGLLIMVTIVAVFIAIKV
jgi:hypothetical protein